MLSADFLAPLPDRAGLAADLDSVLAGRAAISRTRSTWLRRWANERRFQVGVQLLRRDLDGARAGAALADIAETVLAALLPRSPPISPASTARVPGGEFRGRSRWGGSAAAR